MKFIDDFCRPATYSVTEFEARPRKWQQAQKILSLTSERYRIRLVREGTQDSAKAGAVAALQMLFGRG